MNGMCFICVEGVTYYVFIMGHFFDTFHIAIGPTVSLVFFLLCSLMHDPEALHMPCRLFSYVCLSVYVHNALCVQFHVMCGVCMPLMYIYIYICVCLYSMYIIHVSPLLCMCSVMKQ